MDVAHVEWFRQLFARLQEGSIWGIPRSGLVFTKRGAEMVLTERMPWDPRMPITRAQLQAMQDHEFAQTRKHFQMAGIRCWDGSGG